MPRLERMWRTLLLPALAASLAGPSTEAAQVSPGSIALPAGPGSAIVRSRCLACHETDLIVSQRLSEVGWSREIDKMVRWGAAVEASERGPLAAYLAAHFAPAPVASRGTGADGEAVFTRACLVCHGRDLTEQQRLTPAGWAREVDKMVRWGASVTLEEKTTLVEYLASRYTSR